MRGKRRWLSLACELTLGGGEGCDGGLTAERELFSSLLHAVGANGHL